MRDRLVRLLAEPEAPKAANSEGAYALGTAVGSVRRENEDCAVIVRGRFGRRGARDFDLAIVCDGMGGMRDGKEAAILALVEFVTEFLTLEHLPAEPRSLHAMLAANGAIHDRLRGSGGCTLTAALIRRFEEPLVTHAGDSRAYAISKNGGAKLLTRDDTLSVALNRKFDAGDARGGGLVQFVGMGDGFEPHVGRASTTGDGLLLTSDGIHGVSEQALNKVVAAASAPNDLVRRLLLLADISGGLDNATAAVIPFRIGSASDYDDYPSLTVLTCFRQLEIWNITDHPFSSQTRHVSEGRQETVGLALTSKVENSSKRSRPNNNKKVSKKVQNKSAQLDLGTKGDLSIEFPEADK